MFFLDLLYLSGDLSDDSVVHHKKMVTTNFSCLCLPFPPCTCHTDLCCATNMCVRLRVCVSDASNLMVVTPICLPRLSCFTMGRVGMRISWRSRPIADMPNSKTWLSLTTCLYFTFIPLSLSLTHIHMNCPDTHCSTSSTEATMAAADNWDQIKVCICTCKQHAFIGSWGQV